jgi:pseudaminic acid synthase
METELCININGRLIGLGQPVYIIAEMSANHHQSFDKAVRILQEAKNAGADAIKVQTYSPETHTLNSDADIFYLPKGTPWEGRTLYQLYGEAYMPWEWQPKLKSIADEIGIDLFSSVVDVTGLDFLEQADFPAYKIGSFEIVDIPLLKRVAKTGKPIIMSTGMATMSEIFEAVSAITENGGAELALLKCTSGYPSKLEEINLRTIPHLESAFSVPVGLSDHTLELAVPVAAVALGARIIEKHFTLSRADAGPDSSFSLEPKEFKEMVKAIRSSEQALGRIHYGPSEFESNSLAFRRSLFVIRELRAGDAFTPENVRSIRPAGGLHPRYLELVIGRTAVMDINAGTPLSWDLVGGYPKNL